jgi:hypothetical protein
MLLVQHDEQSADAIVRAAELAGRAITSLPETPVSAAGVNFRFRFGALPDELIAALKSPLDDRLSHADLRIRGRSLKRILGWKQGALNVDLQEHEDAAGILLFNFHLASSVGNELVAWLGQARTMHEHAIALLTGPFEAKLVGA